MQSEPWFSNETKLGLGLAGGALATLGIFALAVKFAPSTGKNVKLNAVRSNSDIPQVGGEGGHTDLVPMKTMQVTLSMQVPRDFSKREIESLFERFNRLDVILEPSCRYLGVDAVGEPWGMPLRTAGR